MNRRDLDQHVTILGWAFIALHIVFLLIGGFVFLLLTSIGALSADVTAMPILTVIGLFVGAMMALLGFPGVLAGYGLLKRRNWGRILAIVIGALNLPNFPLGTILGVYTLWVLLQEGASELFV